MAIGDFRFPYPKLEEESPEDALSAKIERAFQEAGHEAGLGDVAPLPGLEQPEEFTLVYDKFSNHNK